jgi:hypothetical protein
MRRNGWRLVAIGALALTLPAIASGGAAAKFVRVAFPTIGEQQTAAAPGLCKDGAWQVLAKAHGDPFKTETQCVKYAARSAVFGLPSASYRRSWALLRTPLDPKLPQTPCSNASSVACVVFYKGLQVPPGGKSQDFGVPEDPPEQQPVSLATTGMMLQGSVTSVDASACAASKRVSYTAAGRSLGPYPGTFAETGTIAYGGASGRRIESVAIDLVVESDVGRVHMTYEGAVPPPPSSSGEAVCFSTLGIRLVHVGAFLPFRATITRPDGTTFEDLGDSVVTASFAHNGAAALTSTFESDAQSILLPSNASLPAPTPVCPPEGCS